MENIPGFDTYITPIVQADARNKYSLMYDSFKALNETYFYHGHMGTINYLWLQACFHGVYASYNSRVDDPFITFGGMPLHAVRDIATTLNVDASIGAGGEADFVTSTRRGVKSISEEFPGFPEGYIPSRVQSFLPKQILKGEESKKDSIAWWTKQVGGGEGMRMAMTSILLGNFAGRTARNIFNIGPLLHKIESRRGTSKLPVKYEFDPIYNYYLNQLAYLDQQADPAGEKIGVFPLLGVRNTLFNLGAAHYRRYQESLETHPNYIPWHLLHTVMLSTLGVPYVGREDLDKVVNDLPSDLRLGSTPVFRREMLTHLVHPDPLRMAAAYVFLVGSKPQVYLGPIRNRIGIPEGFNTLRIPERRDMAVRVAEAWLGKITSRSGANEEESEIE